MGLTHSTVVAVKLAAGAEDASSYSVFAVDDAVCSTDEPCAWQRRQARNRLAPYALHTLCKSHKYTLAATLVDMVMRGDLDCVHACSDYSVTAIVRGTQPRILHVLVLNATSGNMSRVVSDDDDDSPIHVRFEWERRVFGPAEAPASARHLLKCMCMPSTRVFAVNQGAEAPTVSLGPWLNPTAIKSNPLCASITRHENQRFLQWNFSHQVRRDVLAQSMSVLFEQTTMPDPRLPLGGVRPLWQWLGGEAIASLWVRDVATHAPASTFKPLVRSPFVSKNKLAY